MGQLGWPPSHLTIWILNWDPPISQKLDQKRTRTRIVHRIPDVGEGDSHVLDRMNFVELRSGWLLVSQSRKQLLHQQVIYKGKLEYLVKPYHPSARNKKGKKCHSLQLCMTCSQQHPFESRSTHKIKCANCGQSHYTSHSACPHV